jgi:hypothetical protein
MVAEGSGNSFGSDSDMVSFDYFGAKQLLLAATI